MGLDISASSKIKIRSFEASDDDWDDYKSGIFTDYINPDFPHATPEDWVGREVVVWSETPFSKDISFRAGSYSGYGMWRGMLADFSFGQDTYVDTNVFADIQAGNYDDFPFVELINFSDAEGCFYGPVCAKLYQDFVNNRDAYYEFIEKHEQVTVFKDHYTSLYDDWMRAFEYASNDGIVSFH